jgi:hypothetical protein
MRKSSVNNPVIRPRIKQLRNEPNICPYLCLRSDERTSASYPRNDHQCKQAGNALVTLDWQRRYCLDANHQRCRTLHFPEFYRPRNAVQRRYATRQKPLRGGLLAGLGIIIFLAGSIGALEGPREVLEALGPWMVSLHVKDVTARRINYTMGFAVEGCPAGEGLLDIPWLLEEVKSKGRDPNAILELWPPRLGDLDATIAQEDAWVASSIGYLRRFIPS